MTIRDSDCHSSRKPLLNACILNPCSKSTIQTKVAARKARNQRILDSRRMAGKIRLLLANRGWSPARCFLAEHRIPQNPISRAWEFRNSKVAPDVWVGFSFTLVFHEKNTLLLAPSFSSSRCRCVRISHHRSPIRFWLSRQTCSLLTHHSRL